jgi:hypothetical protein
VSSGRLDDEFEAERLLEEALILGEFERGDVGYITGLPERTLASVLRSITSAAGCSATSSLL